MLRNPGGLLAAEGAGGGLALRLEGACHGGGLGESAVVGNVLQPAVGLLVDEADGMAHAVLVDHVVEVGVAQSADGLGEVLGVGGEALAERVAHDVFLGEEEVVAHQVIKAAGEVVEAGFTQAAVNGRGVLDGGFVGFGLGVYLLDDAIGGWGEDGAPGVEGENTEPDVNAREDDIAYGLERGVVDEVVDGHGCTDADRQPLDTTSEAHREVVFVGVGLLVGIADGVAYLLGHAHGAPEVDEEDKRGGGLYPRYDGGGEHGEAEGRRQQQGQQEGGGEVKQVVERRMLLAGEEVALAHD